MTGVQTCALPILTTFQLCSHSGCTNILTGLFLVCSPLTPHPSPLPHTQEVNHQRSGDPGQPPEPRPRRRRSSPSAGPPGLGVPVSGSGLPVCHPPPAAGLAAPVLPGEPAPPRPTGAGGGGRPDGAQPEVPYPPGRSAPAPRLSDEERRPRMVPAEPGERERQRGRLWVCTVCVSVCVFGQYV